VAHLTWNSLDDLLGHLRGHVDHSIFICLVAEDDLVVGCKLQNFLNPKGLIHGLYRNIKMQHEKTMFGAQTYILMDIDLWIPKL
jgi:hypothetical protein